MADARPRVVSSTTWIPDPSGPRWRTWGGEVARSSSEARRGMETVVVVAVVVVVVVVVVY